jgi:hypothetical protein
MNKEAYRKLDHEEIVTKHHYWPLDYELVLLPSNDPYIGKKAGDLYIYEKVSLDDFRLLNDDEIITREHFFVFRYIEGYLIMCRLYNSVGRKADDVRKEDSSLPEFNLYAKKETQINFGKFDFLKDIEL